MNYGRRTLRTDANGILRLLQALSADPDVRVVGDPIPMGAAIAGDVRVVGHNKLELDIVSHDWPDGVDPNSPLKFTYARRYGHTDTHGDWSAPISVGGA